MALRNQETDFIIANQFARWRDAAVYAYCANRPLNRFATIHLEQAGVWRHQPFVTALLKQMGEWLRRRTRLSAFYCYVLENPMPTDDDPGGLHLHLLIHVPDDLWAEFQSSQRHWLELAGGKWKRRVVKVLTVANTGPTDDMDEYLRTDLPRLLGYLLKGIEPNSAPVFGRAHTPQGTITGKRIGHAEALGKQHRWKPEWVRPEQGIWIPGPESRRRHRLHWINPQLLGLSAETEVEGWD